MDTIDLYYQHRQDKTREPEEVAETFAELIKEGKIRYWGISNATYTAWKNWRRELLNHAFEVARSRRRWLLFGYMLIKYILNYLPNFELIVYLLLAECPLTKSVNGAKVNNKISSKPLIEESTSRQTNRRELPAGVKAVNAF